MLNPHRVTCDLNFYQYLVCAALAAIKISYDSGGGLPLEELSIPGDPVVVDLVATDWVHREDVPKVPVQVFQTRELCKQFFLCNALVCNYSLMVLPVILAGLQVTDKPFDRCGVHLATA